MLQDVRYGLRMLRKNLGLTLVAVLSLGIGIGATTTVFSIANAVLLRPLPIANSEGLVTAHKPAANGTELHVISYPDYLDYLENNEAFSEMLVWSEAQLSLNIDGQPESYYGVVVSGNYFSMLGVQPTLGRFFTPEEDRTPGANPVTVISFGLWQSRFGSDSSVVGQTIKLNGHPFTIIGVAPKNFTGTYSLFSPALYVPLMMQSQVLSKPDIFGARMAKYLKVTGRLRQGLTREQAQAALTSLDQQLEAAHPKKGETSLRPYFAVELDPIGSFPPEVRLLILGAAGLLMAIVGSVLLIASANVAGMLLARATTRQREVAVRLAMGATRVRLIRQMLTESGVLFLLSAVAGIALTVWLTNLLSAIRLPSSIPIALDATVDWRVLAFTLMLTLAISIVFGLAPAVAASKADLISALKDTPSMLGVKRSRLRNVFVIAQIALALVLLVGAGLFGRALHYAETIYPGEQPETVLTAGLDPRLRGYSVVRALEFYQRLTERLEVVPGVESVSMTRALQLGLDSSNTSVSLKEAPQETFKVETNTVAPYYFQTLGITLLSGREFSSADRKGAPLVVIINEAMSRRFWPGENAIGKQVNAGGSSWAEVIGVVENGRYRISGEEPPPFVYRPLLQSESNNEAVTVLMRHRGPAATVLAAIREEVQELDPNLPVESPMTLSEAVRQSTVPWRIVGTLARGFGLIGLALASLGIYGLVSYTASQRTHEMGVRVALGAQRNDILKLVVGQGLRLGIFGVIIGLALSFGLTPALSELLFGISTSDPLTYFSVSGLLVVVAVVASLGPARAATRTDPLGALRHE